MQGLNPRLLHWQADSLPLSHQGSLLAVIAVVITVSWARITQLDPSDEDEKSFLCGWRWVWAFHMGLTSGPLWDSPADTLLCPSEPGSLSPKGSCYARGRARLGARGPGF